MFCKNCGSEVKEGNKFCTNCGKPIDNISDNIPPKEKKSKKKYVIISIVVLIIIGITITGVIAVPKIINQIEEKKYKAEMQQDLENMDIALKVETITLPSQGIYNQNLYEVKYPNILENSNDYTKYEELLDNYKGGKLEITGNVDIGTIGQYEVNYTVRSEKGNIKVAKLNVKVEDYMRPEIYVQNDTIQITKGTNVNILDGVTVEDNIDDNKELASRITTEGIVDINKIGEYVITYKVTDTAGWSNERTRTYKVIEKQANIKTGVEYVYRIYNKNYSNGYADNTIIFKSNKKIEYCEVDGMDYMIYTGSYNISDNIITSNVQTDPTDPYLGGMHKTLKIEIKDANTIKDLDTGYVYKTK